MRDTPRSDLSVSTKKHKNLLKKTVIKIPSEKRFIAEASSKIITDLKKCSIDEDTIFNIKLCIDEAIANAMVHGNKLDQKSSVSITYLIKNGLFTATVKDKGIGFDFHKIIDPTEDYNVLKSSGRGIYLIKKFMDKVEYNSKGNRLTMRKRVI